MQQTSIFKKINYEMEKKKHLINNLYMVSFPYDKLFYSIWVKNYVPIKLLFYILLFLHAK